MRPVDDRTVELNFGSLQPGCVYHIALNEAVKSTTQEAPAFRDFYYTANRVPTAARAPLAGRL